VDVAATKKNPSSPNEAVSRGLICWLLYPRIEHETSTEAAS
jgi:hypothetical protein